MKNDYSLDVVRVRLVKDNPLKYPGPVEGPRDVLNIIADELSAYDREVVAVLNIRTDGRVASILNFNLVSMGTLNYSVIHPREVFVSAILSQANYILLAHNHPSSNCRPSPEDMQVTQQMAAAGELLGIELADHLIIGGQTGEIYSMRENGMMPYVKGKKYRELLSMAKKSPKKDEYSL